MFWCFGHEAYGILAPWLGTEPTAAPPALKNEVLATGPPEKPPFTLFSALIHIFLQAGKTKAETTDCLLCVLSLQTSVSFFFSPSSGFTLLSHFQSPQRSSETFPQTVSLFLCGTQLHCISQPSLQLAVAMWMKSWPMEGGQNWYVTSRLIKSHLHTALFSSSIRVLWMVWGPWRWWGPRQMSRFLKDGAEMHELLPDRCTLKCRQCITNFHSVKPLNFGDC